VPQDAVTVTCNDDDVERSTARRRADSARRAVLLESRHPGRRLSVSCQPLLHLTRPGYRYVADRHHLRGLDLGQNQWLRDRDTEGNCLLLHLSLLENLLYVEK